jgi:N utilization substance protein B
VHDAEQLKGFEEGDADFLRAELTGVVGSAEALRTQLEPLVGRKWAEVSPVEKAVLLIGAWELQSLPEVPYRVAINEALELAKRFGGTDGHRFVNGVLDRVAATVRADEMSLAPTHAPRSRGGRPPSVKPPKVEA